jgi:UrcA family protein
MSDHHFLSCAAAALISATALFAAVPFAAAAETHSVAVEASDLDLASDAGQAVLRQRIGHAVDRICGSSHARSTWEEQNYADCSKAARADAASQFDAMVAAAVNGRKVATDRNAAMSVQ